MNRPPSWYTVAVPPQKDRFSDPLSRPAPMPERQPARSDRGLPDLGRGRIGGVGGDREPAGTPIPGSRFVRGYCTVCDDHVRISPDRDVVPVCSMCSAGSLDHGNWHSATPRSDREYHGSQFHRGEW